MTLSDFMARALDFFAKHEATDASKAKAAELEKVNAEQAKTIGEQAGKLLELNQALEKARGEVNTKGTEITKLQASLETEKKRVDETLASMGVAPSSIPAEQPKAEGKRSDIVAQYEAITDPTERMRFYRQHKAEYDAAWRKQQ